MADRFGFVWPIHSQPAESFKDSELRSSWIFGLLQSARIHLTRGRPNRLPYASNSSILTSCDSLQAIDSLNIVANCSIQTCTGHPHFEAGSSASMP